MKLKVPQTISNVDNFDDLKRFTDQITSALVSIVNGGLNFGDNVAVSFTTFTFIAANTTYQINHTLGVIPTGYIPISKSISTDIYNGTGSSTTTYLYLKSSVANATVTVMVF